MDAALLSIQQALLAQTYVVPFSDNNSIYNVEMWDPKTLTFTVMAGATQALAAALTHAVTMTCCEALWRPRDTLRAEHPMPSPHARLGL